MSTSRQPTEQPAAPLVAAPFRLLVDDAAIFPPGNAALPRAVFEHQAHKRAAYADLVGVFVINDIALPDLAKVLANDPSNDTSADMFGPLAVTVVVSGGAGALEPAVRWANSDERLEVRSVEIALRDEDDLAHNARRVVTAADQLVSSGHLQEDIPVYVEPPRLLGAAPGHSWLAALDEVAAADLRLKFRTGGLDPADFPSARDVATSIESALDRELPFKCTAGLHRALRHRDEETGSEHHGFLNVLLATRASLDGAGPVDVVACLEQSDPSTLTGLLADIGERGLVSARRWFIAFGSCSVREPLTDLVDLGLVHKSTQESA